jgi:DNA-nicking Smr family endonuclease
MARKKPNKEFGNTPFKNLKGVSVSQPAESSARPATDADPGPAASEDDFRAEMAQLGVKPLVGGAPADTEPADVVAPLEGTDPSDDRALFLASLGTLNARFTDEWPEPPAATGQPRRMKQLQRGRIKIEARLDLHGLTRIEALERAGHFLDNAAFHQLQAVLIVTGKGAHSSDGPVLRDALEAYLQANPHRAVVEWGRAPREHGGAGALVVFLRPCND